MCIVWANTTLAVVGWLMPRMLNWIGFHGTFWAYGAVAFAVCLYGYVTIPETSGRSLVAVEKHFDEKGRGAGVEEEQ